jgi:benzoyl-CoA 2,3-dioxygenase component B
MNFDPDGRLLSKEEWERRRDQWLPSTADKSYVKSLQAKPVDKPGEMANWIAPPPRGINNRPIEFTYVRAEA